MIKHNEDKELNRRLSARISQMADTWPEGSTLVTIYLDGAAIAEIEVYGSTTRIPDFALSSVRCAIRRAEGIIPTSDTILADLTR